jgi:ATP-dependent RNA helicase RhlE
VIGGVAFAPQEKALRQGVDVIVATPGRLLDHLRQGNARLSEVRYLVVDEADRMLDMGFLPDVRRILGRLPTARQTLFFSATMPAPVARLAQEILHQPVSLSVERPSMPATGVAQTVFPVSEEGKRPLLLDLLRRGDIGNALVFTRTKHRADRLAAWLAKSGIPCEKIHGDLGQARRTSAMERFKSGRSRVLVATDVAARGIDIEGLTHVINFDVPKAPDDYIHRVGRTARADATGDAFTFVAASELPDLHAIERALGRKLPRRTLDSLATLPVVTAGAPAEAEPTRAAMPLTGRARYGAPVRRRLW